jgi:hypothetical protein
LLVKVFCEGPDQRRKVDVIPRISRCQLEKLESRNLLEPANAASSQPLVDAGRFPNAQVDRQTRMSSGIKPDNKIVDVRSEQWKRGEASVNAWKQLNEHSGLLGWKATRLQASYVKRSDPAAVGDPARTPHNQVLNMNQLMWSCTLVDEMGYLNLRPEQTNIFFKLMEERYHQHATIITTNLDYSEWANFLGNKALVGALLSRLRHQCHTVKIDGPSLRDGDA